MDLELEEKKVLITGACQGIGYATACGFLEEGAYVCITGRNDKRLKKTVDSLREKYGKRIMGVCCDATSQEGIDCLVKHIEAEWKKIDIIVPNIGNGKPMNSNPMILEDWIDKFNVNAFSVVKLLHSIDDLISNNNASIVLISSIVGREVFGSSYAYAASKKTLNVLCKYIAKDYAKRNIRINCVLPGNVLFEGGRWEEIINERGEQVYSDISRKVPLGRFANTSEVADCILFLASKRASFITGSSIAVDGGQLSAVE